MGDLHPLNRTGNWLKWVRCMPKSILFVALFVVFGLFIVLQAENIQAGTAIIGGINIEYELLENTDFCLTNCYLRFRFRIDQDYTINSLDKFKRVFKKVKGDVNIIDHGFRIRKNETYSITGWVPSVSCTTQTTPNGTEETCTDNGGYVATEKSRYVWNEFNPLGKTIKADTWYYIELWARKELKLGRDAVDAVPILADFEFPFAIWDSYTYRYEIFSNATGVYPININDTNAPNVWTLNATAGEHKYLYCVVAGCTDGNWSIGNKTDETHWENASSLDGWNPTSVWGNDAVAVWHFDSVFEQRANDSSIYGNDGVANGNLFKTGGVFDNASDFNATADKYFNVTDNAHFNNDDLTVMFWINMDTIGGDFVPISKWDTSSTRAWTFYFFESGGTVDYFRMHKSHDGAATVEFNDSTTGLGLTTGTWYHIAMVYDSSDSNVTFYVDGVSKTPLGEYFKNAGIANTGVLHVGYNPDQGSGLDGKIDEFRIYNTSLSGDEILNHYYIGIDNQTDFGGAEISTITSGGLEFGDPTLANASYTLNDYIEVNATSSENATSCDLEWNDGTPANVSMAVTNADGNTSCWLNQTGLADGEYLFTVYGDLIAIGLNRTGERNITVDILPPTVSIISPTGVVTSTKFDLSHTANDTNLDSCWYSFDSGANTTLSGCSNTTLSVSTSGSHTVEVYVNDSANNIVGNTSTFIVALFTLAVYNASDNATITDWHVHMINGSGATYTNYTNTNTFTINISNVPTGSSEVEMTIWKSGYGNGTYNFSNDGSGSIHFDRHIIADNFFVNIERPANNSIQFADSPFILNITLPNYAEGNASIWYYLNTTSSYLFGCHNCTSYTASVSLVSGPHNITALINNSQHYLGVNGNTSTISIEVYNSKYNVSFFDEMTNLSIDFTSKNGTLEFFCSDNTLRNTITGTLHEYVVNCSGTLDYVKFKLYDGSYGDHYRTLIPGVRTGNITFYMINTTGNANTVVKNTLTVIDTSKLYLGGTLHVRKVILGEGQKDIIDQDLSAVDTAELHLIVGETYTLYIVDSNGANSKTLGKFTLKSTDTALNIILSEIAFIPSYNFIGTDISWSMQFNETLESILFYWNDTLNETTLIKFWIYNASNMSVRTQMDYQEVSHTSNHLFQWNYSVHGSENDTYIGYFEVTNTRWGNITRSETLTRWQKFEAFLGNIGIGWYQIVAIFLLIMLASIFGAMHAPSGAIVVAIMGGLFFMIGWLPVTEGYSYLIMMFLIVMAFLSKFSRRGERRI